MPNPRLAPLYLSIPDVNNIEVEDWVNCQQQVLISQHVKKIQKYQFEYEIFELPCIT